MTSPPSTALVYAGRRPSTAVRALTAPGRGLKALTRMVFGRGGGIVWRFMPRTRFDYAREVGDGMSSSVLMAPILWIVRTFPEAPLMVLDPDEQPVDDHPLIKLLRRPNPFFSGIVMWMATLISWVLDGNAYWLKVRNKAGTGTVELWYVPHWMIEPVSDSDDEFISKYRYVPGGQQIDLDIDEVVHFRYGIDPRNPRKGLSPIGSLFREIFSDEEAANMSAALLRNVGVPGLIVSPKIGAAAPDDDDVEATKSYVRERFGGDRRGEPLVMSGPTDVEQFGFSPEQMQMRELRRIPEERVTAVLGLSAMIVGLGAGLDRSTFQNYAEAREAAYESNIIPTQRLMAEDVRNQLLIPDFQDGVDDGHEVAFDLRKVRVLQDDRNKEAERLVSLYKGGLITRAEGRKPLGEESTDADDVYAVPVSTVLTPAGELPGEEGDTVPDSEDVKRRRDFELVYGCGEFHKRRSTKATAASDRLIEAFARDRAVLEPVLAQQIESDLDGLARVASREYEQQLAHKRRRNGHAKADTPSDDDAQLVDAIMSALGVTDWKDSTLKDRLGQHWLRTAEMTVNTINAVMELGVNLPDPVQRKILDEGGRRVGLIDIDQHTRDAIFRALADGREAGDGPIAIARRIRQYVPSGRFVNAGANYRAELIARTETMNAQRQSSLDAYKAAPNVSAVELRDGLLANSDATCEERDGDIVSFDDAQRLAYDEHPMGTLSFSPVVGQADAVDLTPA